MLNRELEVTLNLAFKEARAKRHEFMTVEHLLLALLDNEAAATVLQACGANLDKLRRDLQEFIDSTTPLIPQHDEERETQPTLGFQRVLQRAVFHVQSSGKREVTGANVLVAIFSEQESQAVFLLKQQSVARIDVVNYIAHGISKVPGHAEHPQDSEQEMQDEEGGESATSSHPLDAYASNLNELARQGRIDPLVGREPEVERVAQVLCPPPQEQPAAGGRGRRRQDRHRRRPGQAHRRGPGAGRAGRQRRLLAGPGCAAGGHQVPRRLREALQGAAQRAAQASARGAVHRRDPHHHRRRCGIGRGHGCLQPAQAAAVLRRDPLHRLDHLPGVPRHLREGSGAGAPLPEGRRHRAVGRGHLRHPEGPEATLRAAPPHRVQRRSAARRGRAGGALHQRPAPAGQGHRRDRRGGRLPAPAAGREAREAHRSAAGRGYRREDRADPAEARVQLRQGAAAQPGARPEADRVRPGRRRSSRCPRRSSWPAPA